MFIDFDYPTLYGYTIGCGPHGVSATCNPGWKVQPKEFLDNICLTTLQTMTVTVNENYSDNFSEPMIGTHLRQTKHFVHFSMEFWKLMLGWTIAFDVGTEYFFTPKMISTDTKKRMF